MTVDKICGIETEFGISGGPENDPITASALIVNAYAQQGRTRLHWDYQHETPGNDARGGTRFESLAPPIEPELANTVLTNGARLYVDHAHPEYSSPEVRTPREAVLYDQAGEEVLRRAAVAVNETLPPALHVRIYKNNSDGKGNAYGTHENYLVDRAIAFDDLVRGMLPHFISRQIITGAGKVGAETDEARGYGATFQISARAEFFEEVVGLETTLKRPLMNTRDEPHANPERYRRLHVINGDASMSPVATLLKVGVTSLLLAYIEERGTRFLPPVPTRPVSAFRAFARDTSLATAVETDTGTWSAVNYQNELYTLLANFAQEADTTTVAPSTEVTELLIEWRALLDDLESDPLRAADRIDWIAKKRIVDGFADRHGLAPSDPKLKAIDLQYHDIAPERSLAARAGLVQLFTPSTIAAAVHTPPSSTRAYFRGMAVTKFGGDIVSANWDSIVFDTPEFGLQRVTMNEPGRGTKALTEALFERCATSGEFVVTLTD